MRGEPAMRRAPAPRPPVPAAPGPPTWEELSALRWGPAVGDTTPGIDVPRDWRWDVANLPPETWSRWRALSGELRAGLEGEPTADDIRAADHMAYDLVQAQGSES